MAEIGGHMPQTALMASVGCRRQGLPLRVFPLFRFPALSLFPGHSPAHEAR